MGRGAVAQHLGLPLQDVRVYGTTVGGLFGGKTVLLESQVGALAQVVHFPVPMILDCLQDFQRNNPGRGALIKANIGGKRDGSLTATSPCPLRLRRRGGAPARWSAMTIDATYRCPNLDLLGYEMATNKTPNRARQAFSALESAMDERIRRMDWDPVTFRTALPQRPRHSSVTESPAAQAPGLSPMRYPLVPWALSMPRKNFWGGRALPQRIGPSAHRNPHL
jgi:CO/xanthine dehydrogenase Mo-binding subunit